ECRGERRLTSRTWTTASHSAAWPLGAPFGRGAPLARSLTYAGGHRGQSREDSTRSLEEGSRMLARASGAKPEVGAECGRRVFHRAGARGAPCDGCRSSNPRPKLHARESPGAVHPAALLLGEHVAGAAELLGEVLEL